MLNYKLLPRATHSDLERELLNFLRQSIETSAFPHLYTDLETAIKGFFRRCENDERNKDAVKPFFLAPMLRKFLYKVAYHSVWIENITWKRLFLTSKLGSFDWTYDEQYKHWKILVRGTDVGSRNTSHRLTTDSKKMGML